MSSKKKAIERQVQNQLAALRCRLVELGKARGVAVKLRPRPRLSEVLKTLDRLDVAPGPFFAGAFWAAAMNELAAARGVELGISRWLAFEEVMAALRTLAVGEPGTSPG